MSSVLISEVGPRDGLQSVKATMPTANKLAWLDALNAAGLCEIEVGSFVPAKLLPQMADVALVVLDNCRVRLGVLSIGATTWLRDDHSCSNKIFKVALLPRW